MVGNLPLRREKMSCNGVGRRQCRDSKVTEGFEYSTGEQGSEFEAVLAMQRGEILDGAFEGKFWLGVDLMLCDYSLRGASRALCLIRTSTIP